MAVEQLITQHIDTWTSALKTRSTAGRGSNGKIDLYGIKKLRDLILELAVHGKLVPQDPNDEPASELLKRIAAEKAALVKQGKIKKQKPLPEISEDEKPFKLPVGWEWARLGEFTSIIRGITFPGSEKSNTGAMGKIACLRTANVQDNIEWHDLIYISDSFVKRQEQYLQDNDIVMSMANSRELVGKVALAKLTSEKSITFGGFLSVLRPLKINVSYLMALLRSDTNKTQLIESASQTTNIANISLAKLNPLVVGIPPADEQSRIVLKFNELMSLCDQLEQQSLTSLDAHQQLVETLLATLTDSQNTEELAENWARISQHFDTLFTTEASIDALKQTILQLAVMGKLVPQDPNDEPASELLKRIEQEKAQLVKEGKIKKQKPLPPVNDEEKPFVLPQGWEWVQVQDICSKITDGEHSTPPRSESGYYLLSARNITNYGISVSDVDYVPAEVFSKIRSRCDPNIGDVLISCSGSIGRVALVDKDDAYSMVRSAAMIRPVSGKLNLQYIMNALKSPMLQTQMTIRSKKSAQANLFLGAISCLVLPLPPMKEQIAISLKINEFHNLCDNLKSRLQSAQQIQLHLADALTDAALT